MPQKHKRWYDKNRNLALALDKFKKVHPKHSVDIIRTLLDMINESNPEILRNFIIPNDIDKWCRRWYDKDPAYWLVINGLKLAKKPLLNKVIAYLKKQLE